jgi:hypothetical protein
MTCFYAKTVTSVKPRRHSLGKLPAFEISRHLVIGANLPKKH